MRFEKVSYDAFKKEMIRNGFSLEDIISAYEKIKLPKRKTKYSCGYDVCTPIDFDLYPSMCKVIPCGIKAVFEPEEAEKYFMALYIRSSVGIRRRVNLSNGTGIIDSDYADNPDNEGCILMALTNEGYDYCHFKAGERIMQAVFCRYGVADNDNADGVRIGGVGSTGA